MQYYFGHIILAMALLGVLGVGMLGVMVGFAAASGPGQTDTVTLPNCIGVAGDSLAAGSLVVQLPGVNFVTITTRPLAVVIENVLNETPYADVPVYDFSLEAANLADGGRTPYRANAAYTRLLENACDVVVMTAWNNDLRVNRPEGPQAYVDDVTAFINEVRAVNGQTRVLVWTHFWGAPQNFVEGYGNGITYNNSQAHREAVLAACNAPDGQLAVLGRVQCIDLDALFEGELIYNVVIGNMSRNYFNSLVYGGYSAEERGYVDFFFNQNPDNQAVGDGVHFTEYGKRQLAATVLAFLDAPPAPPPSRIPLPDLLSSYRAAILQLFRQQRPAVPLCVLGVCWAGA